MGRGIGSGTSSYVHDKYTIMHNNIRSFTSRKVSFHNIIDRVSPDVITLNETNLKGNKKPDTPGYFAFNKNRKGKNGWGVCTLVKHEDKDFPL